MAGCYIDTLNPFSKGSRVLLQLNYKNANFVALSNVISTHMGMGMGLSFEKLEAANRKRFRRIGCAAATW